MAYVTVPKDLTRVKSKVVLGLTKRQLICFGGSLLVGVPLFLLIRGRIPTSAAALIMVFAMLPGFLLALYERHGQPLEVVVWQIIQCSFIQPKERPYQTNNAYSALIRQHQMEKEVNAIVQKAKARGAGKDAGKAHPRRKERNSGHDMDILPSDLATYGQDAKELLKTLQSRNERMFQLTFLVLNTADTRQKLENEIFWASGVAQKYNNSLIRLDYQQEQGLMSSLPLGASHIRIERSLTTSSVAVFVPFVTQELFQGGNAMYYGINAKTGNMIMLDRKQARSPNGLKLGTPGSGKSMSCKSEILSVFLCTQDTCCKSISANYLFIQKFLPFYLELQRKHYSLCPCLRVAHEHFLCAGQCIVPAFNSFWSAIPFRSRRLQGLSD